MKTWAGHRLSARRRDPRSPKLGKSPHDKNRMGTAGSSKMGRAHDSNQKREDLDRAILHASRAGLRSLLAPLVMHGRRYGNDQS